MKKLMKMVGNCLENSCKTLQTERNETQNELLANINWSTVDYVQSRRENNYRERVNRRKYKGKGDEGKTKWLKESNK